MDNLTDPRNPVPAQDVAGLHVLGGATRIEEAFFLAASLISALACAAAFVLRHRVLLHNDRVRYGVDHLPAALLSIAIFTALPVLVRLLPTRTTSFADRSSAYFVVIIAGTFGIFWLPAYLAGGIVQDDWQLLAAASVRKIIYLHPLYSWHALDSVDGNFRPLGTVLYVGYMLKEFGLAAHAFTFGPLLLTLLASLTAFAIVRELGYSRIAAATASLLFLSRGMVYTIATWTSALGDGIAILFCGITALLVLKANRSNRSFAVCYHLLALLFFFLATLGKQSSFVTPLIIALLLFLRPGDADLPTQARRAATAALGFCTYAAIDAIAFFHAKALLHVPSPYPIGFSLKGLFQTFAYATWYFLVAQFPNGFRVANLLPGIFGIAIVAAVTVLALKFPALLGDRPRDVVFACLAAVASISLFVLMDSRSAPYYACMSAFWFSIALGIALTRYGAPRNDNPQGRLSYFLICLLLVSGFAEIRLEQTGLFPSGGYIWGTFGMTTERSVHANLQRALATSPDANLLVMADCPDANQYASMTIVDAPNIQRILMYDSRTGAYTVNDRQGLRPTDGYDGLNDPQSYNWTQPLNVETAASFTARGKVLRLVCHNNRFDTANGQ